MNREYQILSKFILRTPLLPISFYFELTSGDEISDDQLKLIIKNPIIREAIFIASPSFYEVIKKWEQQIPLKASKVENLRITLVKYLSRMSSRATPFGLFAGCSVGEIGQKTEIKLCSPLRNNRKTFIDSRYFSELINSLRENLRIQRRVRYFRNSSLYPLGKKYRYMESTFGKGRNYRTVEIDSSYFLELILKEVENNGADKNRLLDLLSDAGIEKEPAGNFINELIDNEILINEFQISVSGQESLAYLLKALKDIDNEISLKLEEIQLLLNGIDIGMGHSPKEYFNIKNKILSQGIDLPRNMFMVNMFPNSEVNFMGKDHVKKIYRALRFLNKISFKKKNLVLENFKLAFVERYGDTEIPLSIALDSELGIKYGSDNDLGASNPLLDDIVWPSSSENNQLPWNPLFSVLQNKIFEAIHKRKYIIVLNDSDFRQYEENWDDLPDTFGMMIELLSIDESEKVNIKWVGGSSATNLLGRFGHGNDQMKSVIQSIVDIEETINRDEIVAEIVHLPETRLGNVISRPSYRSYEIPYLTNIENAKEISVNDLYVSVKENRIHLRSKRHGKDILPKLSNAHNFSHNSLPIYRFLCDLQTQDIRGNLKLDFGPLANEYIFIPRIEYDNVILHEATWNLKAAHIKTLQVNKNSKRELLIALEEFRNQRNIPNLVKLIEGDNELLVNFENFQSIKMFLDVVKNKKNIKLKEFLYSDNGVVKGEEGFYTNEILLPFYNLEKLSKTL